MFIFKKINSVSSSGNFSFVYLRNNFMGHNLYFMEFLPWDVHLLKSSIKNSDRQLHHQVVPGTKINNEKIFISKNNPYTYIFRLLSGSSAVLTAVNKKLHPNRAFPV
jgi:hypothetical protein